MHVKNVLMLNDTVTNVGRLREKGCTGTYWFQAVGAASVLEGLRINEKRT